MRLRRRRKHATANCTIDVGQLNILRRPHDSQPDAHQEDDKHNPQPTGATTTATTTATVNATVNVTTTTTTRTHPHLCQCAIASDRTRSDVHVEIG